MSGQVGNFDICSAIDNATKRGDEPRRDDGGYDDSRHYSNENRSYRQRDYDNGSRDYHRGDNWDRFDGNRRNDGYGHRNMSSGRYSQHRYDNNHDGPHRSSYHRDDEREGNRYREPRSMADQDDNWRRGGASVVDAEPRRFDRPSYNRGGNYHSGRYNDNRSGGRYYDNRDGGRYYDNRDGGRFNDNRDGGRFNDNRDGGRYYDNRDGGRFNDNREGGRSYRDDRPSYRQSEGEDSGEPRLRDAGRYPSQDMRQQDAPMARTGVKPTKLSNDNAYSALADDDDDVDISSLSMEELKQRAAEKSRREEEEKKAALEAREQAIKKASSMRNSQPERERPSPKEETVDLQLQWDVDLPPKYTDMTLVSFPDSKLASLSADLRQFLSSKQINGLVRYLEDAMTNDRPTILYYLFCCLLRTNTNENRQVYVAMSALKNASAVVTMDMIEEALQKCYLDPQAVSTNLNSLADNFLIVVKVFADNELISHVPSFKKTEEADNNKQVVEEEKEVKDEQEENVKESLSEKAKADFKALLDLNLLSEELGDKAMEMNLEQDPRYVGLLLDLVVPENLEMILKNKNDIWRCVLFRNQNYGDMLFKLYDGVPLEVHVAILNEVVEFWFKKGMPQHFLEACFYSLFENELLYDEALEEWKDQALTSESFKKAIIKLSNTVFQIQEMMDSKE